MMQEEFKVTDFSKKNDNELPRFGFEKDLGDLLDNSVFDAPDEAPRNGAISVSDV